MGAFGACSRAGGFTSCCDLCRPLLKLMMTACVRGVCNICPWDGCVISGMKTRKETDSSGLKSCSIQFVELNFLDCVEATIAMLRFLCDDKVVWKLNSYHFVPSTLNIQ